MLLRYAASGVRDYHADTIPIRRDDAQRTAVRHCVFCVEEQIQENLLQASGVALNERKVGREVILHVDLRDLELVFQQAQRIEDDLIHINFGEFCAAGAREIQKIIDNLRGTECLAGDFL